MSKAIWTRSQFCISRTARRGLWSVRGRTCSAPQFPGVNFGPDSQVSLGPERLKFFDEWLKGVDPGAAPHLAPPPVRIFVMGVNRWRDEEEWPLARAREEKFYLNAGGDLGAKPGHDSPPDTFVYDPRNPAPTVGGAVCCTPEIFPWGPMDQRKVGRRSDEGRARPPSTAPMVAGLLEVTGPIRVILYASSSALDISELHGETGGCFSGWPGAQPYRWNSARAVQEVARIPRADEIRRGVPDDDRCGRDEQRVPRGASHPAGNFEQQFPRFDRNPNTGRPVAEDREGCGRQRHRSDCTTIGTVTHISNCR